MISNESSSFYFFSVLFIFPGVFSSPKTESYFEFVLDLPIRIVTLLKNVHKGVFGYIVLNLLAQKNLVFLHNSFLTLIKLSFLKVVFRGGEMGGNFRKDVSYGNINSHKNQGFTLLLEDTFFEKPQGGGGQIDPPPPPAILELN